MLDKFTEIVAHMIGIFHTTIEAERMRDAYAEFKFKQINPEVNDLEPGSAHFSVRYTLNDFDPKLNYTPLSFDTPYKVWSANLGPTPLAEPYIPAGGTAFSEAYFEQGSLFFPSLARPLLTLEPPGSVVTVSAQSAWMQDNDLLRMNSVHAEFIDPSIYTDALNALKEVAQTLGVLSEEMRLDFNESGYGFFIALHELMRETDATSRLGETVAAQHGSEAYGMFVDGDAVDALPLLDDVLPTLLQSDDNEDEDTTLSAAANGDDLAHSDSFKISNKAEDTDPFRGLNPPSAAEELFGLEDGYQVVTGGNMMLNEVAMNISWLDAHVISVMGDVVELNLISQANVLAEHAIFNGIGQGSLSATYNIAMMSHISSQPASVEGDDLDESNANAEDTYSGLPKNWAVTRIDGDLLAVNWVQQYSFMTDHDRADVKISGTNTYIGMGENVIVNLAALAEIGYGYDLIMIGGNLITINQISQMNVMLDHDSITSVGTLPFGTSVGANLLFNGASISTVGINTYSPMTENFAAASKDFAEGAQTIDQTVAHDGVFTGDEILTVLYIEGDFKTINWVEQTNVLGDSDQIHLALDTFTSQTGSPVKLYAGSNAEANSASINIYGADSEVRVQGEVYSDALLYQANLIDMSADPTGVFMPALANEAVAFLADGMISDPSQSSDDLSIVPTSPESLASPDLMQMMLA
ncbi:type I secretion protein ATPase [Sulfitobacter dubius]|uniref:type I secretion protein ATPase n=1 Tax=Sulfitobacter dubius TaxID=218673 RepID=UPI0022AE7026|nr:type I secretion protein ATPase [Sulfitobacter dubius]MCZ4368793.1 type I secretion protein ATPase [Sulfitobacter dubius]